MLQRCVLFSPDPLKSHHLLPPAVAVRTNVSHRSECMLWEGARSKRGQAVAAAHRLHGLMMSSSTNCSYCSSTGCDSNCVSSELPTGSNQYTSIVNDSQEFCGAWQFSAWQDGCGAPRGPEQTHFIPSTQPVAGDNWRLGAIPPRVASPHWLFPSVFTAAAMHGGTTDDTEVHSTEDWTISTASTVPGISCSAAPYQFEQDLSASALLSPAEADCSDPLVCTAQELVAAAVAALPPGVHAPVADSAALLNSGAVLLFGHASTTMCGTNTAQDAEHTACSLLSADGCDSHVLSTTGSRLQDPSAPVAAMVLPQQEQQAAAAAESRTAAAAATEGLGPGGRAVRARLRSRRRQGLLVDSHAGMQQLVAAAAVSLPSTSPPELQDSTTCVLEQHGTAVLQHAPHVLGGLQCLSAKSGALSDADSHGMLASGDVLVLGVSAPNSGAVRAATIAACAEPAAGAEAAASQEPGQAADEPHMMPAGGGLPAQPVLQLLSCSSLASITHAGRSNSSLGLANLSNCSFMRLGSFSTAHGSFSGSDASSFTSQRQGSFTGMTGAAAGTWPPGSGLAIGGSNTAAPPVGRPSPRPAPLPMLHESCSWGNKLNEADGQAGREQQLPQEQTQRQHDVSSSAQRQLPKPHEPHQQLIYLLD